MFNKKEYMWKYRLERRKEIKKYNQEYREKYREELNARNREYDKKRREEKKAYNREYKEKHKEELKIYNRKYNKKHAKELNIKDLEYRHRKGIYKKYRFEMGISKTPGYRKMKGAERNHNMRKAGKLTFQTIQQVYDENIIVNSGFLRCIYCNKELALKNATLEHKQPLSRSGTNDKENLAIACLHCNSSKGNKTEKEFREWLINKEVKL